MRLLRLRLSSLLTAVLVVQLCGVIAPLAMSAAGLDAEVCTCPGGSHDTCPMHHNKPAGDPNRCAVRSASAPGDVALLTLGTTAGLPPSINTFDPTYQNSSLVSVSIPTVPSRTEFPDSPPPRR